MRSLNICDISYSILISWLSENQREETIENQTNKNKNKNNNKNPFDLQCLLPERYDTMMVTQSLWDQPTHNRLDLKPTLKDETHTLHCLADQEPETQ